MAAWPTCAFVLSVLLLPAAIAGSAVAAPPEPCSVDLAIHDDYIEATVTSTQPGAASTTGTVTATIPPGPERAVITLTATVEAGWAITISPSTITISGSAGRVQDFALTVLAPAAQPVTTTLVTVSARMIVGGFQCTPAVVQKPTVGVRPYVEDVAVKTSEELYPIAGPEGGRDITVGIGSKANTDVHVDLEYEAPPGVRVEGPPSLEVRRSANGTANDTFTVRLRADNLEMGIYKITIKATATAGDSDAVSNTTEISIEVKGRELAGFDSTVTMLAIAGVATSGLLGRARYRKSA